MKTYTEQDLRLAFQAGSERGAFIQAGNYFDAPLDEDEYIESLNPKQETLTYIEAAKKEERIFNSTMFKQETLEEAKDRKYPFKKK